MDEDSEDIAITHDRYKADRWSVEHKDGLTLKQALREVERRMKRYKFVPPSPSTPEEVARMKAWAEKMLPIFEKNPYLELLKTGIVQMDQFPTSAGRDIK